MAGNKTTTDGRQPVVVWDDTPVASTYANISDVSVCREAINIFFGVEQARQSGQEEVPVQLSKQVALSPLVAKRLAVALQNLVNSQKTRGVAEDSVPAVANGDQKAMPQAHRDSSGEDKRLAKVLMLFRHLGDLDAKLDFEHSFKAVQGRLFENRFLLGLSRSETVRSLDDRLALICENIGMPRNLLDSFRQALSDANHVYFGVEKNQETLIFKAYLEYRDKIGKEICGVDVRGRSFPLFIGFKWDACCPSRQSVTRYSWYPSLPVPEMLERMQMTFDSSVHGRLIEVVQSITKRVSARISHSDIQYLEVTEDGNSRRSFDINVYKSGHRLMDIQPFFAKAARYFAIPSERFQPLYERIKTERFGHLGGGVDREDQGFITVYFGAKEIDSGQLRSAVIAPGHRPHSRG